MALWVFFIILMILLSTPYIILYFLPYGFITEKSFIQMPIHIIFASNCFNFTIFCIPIGISLVIYIVLTKKVEVRLKNQRKSSTPSAVHNTERNNLSIFSSTSYSLNDLPYPLNALCDKDTPMCSKNITGKLELRGQVKTNIKTSDFNVANGDANIENDFKSSSAEKQACAEIEAALRSMNSNLTMLLLFIINGFILLMPSEQWRLLTTLSFQSILKFVLPTITMVANFGPVKDVFKLYFNNLKLR